MHVRSKEETSLHLYKKENPVRKEHFHRAMHGTTIDKAGTVEQCRSIGQQLFVLVQLLIATQGGYATIEQHVLTFVGEYRVHIAQVQERIFEFYAIVPIRHNLLFILNSYKGVVLSFQVTGKRYAYTEIITCKKFLSLDKRNTPRLSRERNFLQVIISV